MTFCYCVLAAHLQRDNGEDLGEAAGVQSPQRQPAARDAAAKSPTRGSPRVEAQRQDSEAGGKSYPAWLGKAYRLDGVGKLVISHYEQRIILEKKLDGGDVIQVPRIKYRTKYEPADKERVMTENGFNTSRLGDYLITSDHTPDRVKEEVAKRMRSQVAKRVTQEFDAKRKAGDSMAEALHASKAAKSGSASQKDGARDDTISKYIAVDAAMPDDLYKVVLYSLSVFIFMCRLPFSVAANFHFFRFLWALRPAFAKRITPRYLADLISTDLLDEVYEETKDITAAALADVPGRPTLGMDGHKEGKHRHVETITRAKLGISTFAGAEYMRTTRTSGKNLSEVALKYLTALFIALVADNTGNNTGENTGLFAFVLKVLPTLFCLGCYVHVLGEPADQTRRMLCQSSATPLPASDLLIEDIAKLPKLKKLGDDAHFCVSFIKKHGLLFEEFLICQNKLKVKVRKGVCGCPAPLSCRLTPRYYYYCHHNDVHTAYGMSLTRNYLLWLPTTLTRYLLLISGHFISSPDCSRSSTTYFALRTTYLLY